MPEVKALKLFTKGDYIKSGQRDDISLLKGCGFAHVTHFCMHNCGLRKKSPLHSVKCDTHVADHGLMLITPTALGPLTQRLWPKLHRFDLSLYLLQCWLYIIDNESIRWSLSIIIQIGLCGNNGQDSNLLSTDVRCLVIIFGHMQYGRFFYRTMLC